MAIEPEDMNVKLLGVSERKTVYFCEYCGSHTDGLLSYKGFICCEKCKKVRLKMEKVILEQVKKFIKTSAESETMNSLRKSSYVDGYRACLDDISSLIKMGEELSKAE